MPSIVRFPIILYPDQDYDGAFAVKVPDICGCFASGKTIDEAIRNAEEEIADYIQMSIAIGRQFDSSFPVTSFAELCRTEKPGIFAIALVDISKY